MRNRSLARVNCYLCYVMQLVGMGLIGYHPMQHYCCPTLFSCGFVRFSRNCQWWQNIALKSIGWLSFVLYTLQYTHFSSLLFSF